MPNPYTNNYGGVMRDNEEIIDDLTDELNKLSDLMCYFCRTILSLGMQIPDKVKPWWEKHEAEDALRIKLEEEAKRGEEVRRGALAKLTQEELEVLGLSEK